MGDSRNSGRRYSDYLTVEGKAAAPSVPRSSGTAAKLVPERWVPERILRGQLVGAGLTAEIARCGDGMVLTGRGRAAASPARRAGIQAGPSAASTECRYLRWTATSC
jgi:hypothetical protein